MMMGQERNPEEVARWVNRLDQPTVDTAASEAFDEWMRSDPRNRDDFADMQALWHSDALVNALREVSRDESEAESAVQGGHLLNRRMAGWMVAGMCALLALFLAGPMLFVTTYRTGAGSGQSIVLADGSHVDLSGNAELAVRMLPWKRDVTLVQGEAFFDVRHDPDRPFYVRSDTTKVRVLGTAFNVDRQAANRVIVDVYRGAVAVEADKAAPRVLHRGERSRVLNGGISTSPAIQLATAQARPDWTAGWFEATDVPLAVLVAKVQRHVSQPISFADQSLATLPVSGRFRIAEPDRVLVAIRDAYGLDVRQNGGAIVIAAQAQSSTAN